MKKNILTITLIISSLLFGMEGNAQFAFSVSPGLQLNGASFGFRMENLVIYGGLQVIGGTFTETRKGKEFENNILQDYSQEYKVKGNIFVPCVGAKFFFKDVGKLKMYGNGIFAYFIPSIKISDSQNSSANSDFQDQFNKAHLLGGQLGFGTEYFFDNNFSIGGEFGLTIINGGYEEKYDYDIYNPNTGEYIPTTRYYNYKVSFTPTYIKFSFNFYFNNKEE